MKLTVRKVNYSVGRILRGGPVKTFLGGIFLLLLITSCSKTQKTPDYEVSVTRGEYNQPIIKVTKAPSGELADKRLMEEQGYVMAKDRFLQMDLMRRLPQGKVAEVFGEKAYDSDRDVWTLASLPQTVQRSVDRIYKDYRRDYELLVAFSNGVNRYLNELATDNNEKNKELLRKYQLFTGLRGQKYRPDPWTPADSVSIMTIATFFLSSAFYQKVAFGLVSFKFSLYGNSSDFHKILDFRPLENVDILHTGLTSEPLNVSQVATPFQATQFLLTSISGQAPSIVGPTPYSLSICPESSHVFQGCGFLGQPGSNNWALSPRFTNTGQTILANDPHLTLRMPAAFYEGAYDSSAAGGSFAMAGVQFAGQPGTLIGHNRNVAWVLTNNAADVEELYYEQLNKGNDKYRFKEEFYPIRTETHAIQVRRADGSVYSKPPLLLRYTHETRPLISDHMEVDGEMLSNLLGSKSISYLWTGHEGTPEISAILSMDRAADLEGVREALNAVEAGAQNVVFGDRQGNISYYSHTKYPIRNVAAYSLKDAVLPYLPVDGQSGKFEWLGFRDKMPEIPPGKADRIVTANDDPTGYNQQRNLNDFKDYLGFSFNSGARKTQILSLFDKVRAEKGRVTVDDVKAVQTDHHDLAALRFIGLLRQSDVPFDLEGDLKKFAEKLLKWDGAATRFHVEPLYYLAWLRAMLVRFYSVHNLLPKLANTPGKEAEIKDVDKYLKRVGVSPYGITTVYHWIREGLQEEEALPDPAAEEKRAQMKDKWTAQVKDFLKISIEDAWKDMKKAGWDKELWGKVHPLQFDNPFKSFLPDPFPTNLQRDGTYDTIDVSGFPIDRVYDQLPRILPTHMGPNLHLIMVAEAGKPIWGLNALPGGNWDMDTQKDLLLRDLKLWRDGKYRPLVSFE